MTDYANYRFLKTERIGKVLKLSFNRPGHMNSVTNELHAEMAGIFSDIAWDDETFAVLLTGEGEAYAAFAVRQTLRQRSKTAANESLTLYPAG